jgi:hypothetical protein
MPWLEPDRSCEGSWRRLERDGLEREHFKMGHGGYEREFERCASCRGGVSGRDEVNDTHSYTSEGIELPEDYPYRLTFGWAWGRTDAFAIGVFLETQCCHGKESPYAGLQLGRWLLQIGWLY